MARSFHTDPLRIRAERRTRDPWTKRGAQDERRARAARRRMVTLGHVPVDQPPEPPADEPLPEDEGPAAPRRGLLPPPPPRVDVQAPRPGHLHPASAGEVRERLAALGPRFFYGLTLVELAQGPPGRLVFGRFTPIGQVRLFDVPAPPWRLPGLSIDDALRLLRAGARLSLEEPGVVVDWPGTTLRDFYLDEVLLHELGHHALQHFKGKRAPPQARTKDHEAFARTFAGASRHDPRDGSRRPAADRPARVVDGRRSPSARIAAQHGAPPIPAPRERGP